VRGTCVESVKACENRCVQGTCLAWNPCGVELSVSTHRVLGVECVKSVEQWDHLTAWIVWDCERENACKGMEHGVLGSIPK
jgi:hypothetical protein